MNVDDVDTSIIPKPGKGSDRLKLIFERQHQLIRKYHVIEKGNGLLHTEDVPVHLHDRFGQAQLKDLAWRVTEEITEATLALKEHPDNRTHFLEELSDAFHFLVELSILSGLDHDLLFRKFAGLTDQQTFPEDRCRFYEMFQKCIIGLPHPPKETAIQLLAYETVEAIGAAMNCLKQKPWKQTHMLTDIKKYYNYLLDAYTCFIKLSKAAGLSADGLYHIYYKKSEVNLFRQRTKY